MKFLENLRNLFSKSQRYSEAAVKAINILKFAVESDIAGYITALIPGEVDNKVLEALKKYLPDIAMRLNIVSILNRGNSEIILNELIKYLQKQFKGERGPIYEQLAANIYREMQGRSIQLEDARALTQYVYGELKKKK